MRTIRIYQRNSENLTCTKMAQLTLENGAVVSDQVSDACSGLMEPLTKANGKKARPAAMESLLT